MLLAALLLAVLATATLSGVIGMAGGMILMAVLVLVLPVPAAMVLHGVVQAASNGSRCFILREHIVWAILPPYIAGAALATLGFVVLLVVPDKAVVFILVGAFPWLARLVPYLRGLNVERPLTAAVCGLVVTAAQLLAGASGPLLDVFYLNTRFDRHQVIATKAVTQTFGHLVKLAYYLAVGALVLGEDAEVPAGGLGEVPLWFYPVAVACAFAGARIGTLLLGRLSETRFRQVSEGVILVLATLCLVEGVRSI